MAHLHLAWLWDGRLACTVTAIRIPLYLNTRLHHPQFAANVLYG